MERIFGVFKNRVFIQKMAFLGVLVFALSACCDEVDPYFSYAEMEVSHRNQAQAWTGSDTVFVDSGEVYQIGLNFDLRFHALLPDRGIDHFVAKATTCPDPGEDGTQNPIVAVKVVSHYTFMEQEAGADLNAFFEIDAGLFGDGMMRLDSVLIDYPQRIVNHFNHPYMSRFEITLRERPAANVLQRFSVVATQADGTERKASLPYVILMSEQ